MITIKTEENQKEIKDFLSAQGVSEDLTGAIVMAARDGDEILAMGALSMRNYRVYLDHIILPGDFAEDLNLALGLLKSLLNLADLRGIKTVYGDNPRMEKYYKMLRFRKDEELKDTYVLSLEGYFQCEH